MTRKEQPLEFGTAGVRAIMGDGPTRINRTTIARLALAIAQTAQDNSSFIVGYDARNNSREFAILISSVLLSRGHRISIIPEITVTPLLAWITKKKKADFGIMVTSSHNPHEYNGIKVFGSNGTQIVSPLDKDISNAMDSISWEEAETAGIQQGGHKEQFSSGVDTTTPEDINSYIHSALLPSLNPEREIIIAWTPLHGSAGKYFEKAFSKAGFTTTVPVQEEFEPDGNFPDLSAPNPENPDNLQKVLSLGNAISADLLLATDGDGDRVGAIIPAQFNSWQILNGNEIGALLTWYLLRELQCRNMLTGNEVIISTIVSTPLAQKIAKRFGVHYRETLTGFKWMAQAAEEEEKAGRIPLISFEESNGVAVSPFRDKDGLSALRLLSEAAAHEKEYGTGLFGMQQEIAHCCGLHLEETHEIFFEGSNSLQQMESTLNTIRNNMPKAVAGQNVTTWRDLLLQSHWSHNMNQSFQELPAQNLLKFFLEDGSWFALRPSGTEPKLKIYLGVVVPVESEFTSTWEKALHLLHTLSQEVIQSLKI